MDSIHRSEIEESSVIAVIPARGGSERIPQKNIVPLLNKPLITHSIEHCLDCGFRTIVSTNDDNIATVSELSGAEVIERPDEISRNDSPSEEAIIHVLDNLEEEPEVVIMVQCTSPIRMPKDLLMAYSGFVNRGLDSLFAGYPTWSFAWTPELKPVYDINDRKMSQDRNPYWLETGSFYIFTTELIRETNNRLGGEIGVFGIDNMIDINTLDDLKEAEAYMRYRNEVTS